MFPGLILEVTPWFPSTGKTLGSKNQGNCNSLQFQPKLTKTGYNTITHTATSKNGPCGAFEIIQHLTVSPSYSPTGQQDTDLPFGLKTTISRH
jgi:hypothetical protein